MTICRHRLAKSVAKLYFGKGLLIAIDVPRYPTFVRILVCGFLHPTLAVANFAAWRIDSLAGFGWLFDDFHAAAVTGFAFDFV
jgi:hypothetical protein